MDLDETNNAETFDFSDMQPLAETAQQTDDQDDPLVEPTPPNTPTRVETTTDEVHNGGTDSTTNETDASQDELTTKQQKGASNKTANPNAHTTYLKALTSTSTDAGTHTDTESQGNVWTTVQSKKHSNTKWNNSPKSAQAVESQNVKRSKGDDTSGSLCSMMSPCVSKRPPSEDSQDSVTETLEHPSKTSAPVSANTRHGQQQ